MERREYDVRHEDAFDQNLHRVHAASDARGSRAHRRAGTGSGCLRHAGIVRATQSAGHARAVPLDAIGHGARLCEAGGAEALEEAGREARASRLSAAFA